MREIKFRAWDKKGKKMYEVEAISWLWKYIDVIVGYNKNNYPKIKGMPIEDMELIQFTGLLDKNGKEIYEGDIVEFFDDMDVLRKEPVTFENGSFGFIIGWEQEEFLGFNNEWLNLDELEVIGNIYENPELLEGVRKNG